MFLGTDKVYPFCRVAAQMEELLEYRFLIRKIQMLFCVGTTRRLQIPHVLPFVRSKRLNEGISLRNSQALKEDLVTFNSARI